MDRLREAREVAMRESDSLVREKEELETRISSRRTPLLNLERACRGIEEEKDQLIQERDKAKIKAEAERGVLGDLEKSVEASSPIDRLHPFS